MAHFLDFESSILEVHARIEQLRREQLDNARSESDFAAEIDRLEIKEKRVTRLLYRNLDAWQKTQVARHPDRPHARHYIQSLIDDFTPLAGDRSFGEDKAMLAGVGTFNGQSVCVLGTEKGANTQERVAHNFGMPRPEGYRKAKRIMEMAHKFGLPLLTFVDTPGAFPGVDAEARGQAEAIAACIEVGMRMNVPVVTTVIGEGGSGGALAIAVADRVLMLEHSIYSVISPEGCASILWRDRAAAKDAANALRLTAQDLEELKVIDDVIKEPVGGAHRDPDLVMSRVGKAIQTHLNALQAQKGPYHHSRRDRFLAIGR
ncbi:MAG: acetyl-CoA carboxylase carboxyltransferase subunit alpha [Proteobacteria bacterium]|nr:acetyl-CoA carboxylase carboxyltransferase subunit alpha [Pseudomonadota bacterium]